jgi:pimeloyl-ACP methyl ester carboxylesterase
MPLPTVILPGYLAAAQEYQSLAQSLHDLAIPTAVVPLKRSDWFATIGGRPMTPILQQLDHTIVSLQETTGAAQVNVIGHSAGGWITRIYLGSQKYCGRVWQGQPRVHTLITLGTPHRSQEQWTQKNLDFVNTQYPGAFHAEVRYVCVAGKARRGQRSWRLGQMFTYNSYKITCGQGECWGDGVTPIQAAHLEGAQNLTLENVWHSPPPPQASMRRPWYGSKAIMEQWVSYLT